MHARHLERDWAGRNTIRGTVDALERAGLVVTTKTGGGPALSRWAVLNEGHPLMDPLKQFGSTIVVPRIRRTLPDPLPCHVDVHAAELPGSREFRTLIILDVFENGETTSADISK